MQSPSSLIFLVLIGVWAAYFVQYWIRRRDHLATARSVEQFSAAMRVLERRAPIPRTDLSDPTPRSWAVHPTRSVRPQVVVKRAVPTDPGGVTAAFSRPPDLERTAVPAARIPAVAGGAHPSRRVRALTFLAALVTTLVVTGLAVAGLFAGWAPLVAVLLLVSSFAWLRAGVRTDQAARAARRRRARAETLQRAVAPAASARPAPLRRPVARPAASVGASAGPVDVEVAGAAAAVEPSAPVETTEATIAPVAPAPIAAEPAPAPEPAPVMEIEYVHLVDEDDIPLTWDPVPVPRPTYTMKAKAERPEVAPAAVAPEASSLAAELRSHEDDLDERRVAGA
ncbi:hypothetical protein [Phycicoccus duodecadis]|uniref:Uncharacterized protein n=1 Tax=Phycicoccus duodecadis TaxID=173053 RepID=A0A2N3YKX4_9MICO|nr:hypothetical protein [Phycicoccus duodecadis]PKW27492.1 hypothetical protein ATL31_2337 [Phycicoccus duodecadis]